MFPTPSHEENQLMPLLIYYNKYIITKYVDVTLPFTDLGTAMVVQRENKSNDMWIFLRPLSIDLWITTTIFFTLIGLVAWPIERPTNMLGCCGTGHPITTEVEL